MFSIFTFTSNDQYLNRLKFVCSHNNEELNIIIKTPTSHFLIVPVRPFCYLSKMNELLIKMLKESASDLHIDLDIRAITLFCSYYQELFIWNEKMNLVSVRKPQEIIIKHFVDSLTPLPYIACPAGRLLDIGSGGGFPGIPLKIAMPALSVSLLESSRKKSSFLKHVIRRLPLPLATVIHARTEFAMKEDTYRHHFDTVISRAAFKLPQLLMMSRFFLSPGGLLIAMRGPQSEEDERDIPLDSELHRIACHDIHLPFQGGHRKIILFQRDT
jgi:16S rRNA (guanine527-N7)-methyltransferase